MLYYLVNYFLEKKNHKPIFSKKYMNGYKKLWINELQDYSP